jgi:hypothetical protein
MAATTSDSAPVENTTAIHELDWASAEEGMDKQRPSKIMGLSKKAFWVTVAAIILVLAAAIGGGVGGGLAAKNHS